MRKLLAAMFMLIDHIGVLFQPWLPDTVYTLMRSIGRLAFPIFACYIALGFRRTRNAVHYFLRMAVFAGLTELVFIYSFQLAGLEKDSANVLFTFLAALAFLSGYCLFTQSSLDMVGRLELLPEEGRSQDDKFFQMRLSPFGISLPTWLGRLLGIAVMGLALFFAEWFDTDYGAYGVLAVFVFYLSTDERLETASARIERGIALFIGLNFLALLVFNYVWPKGFSELQFLSIFAVPLLFTTRLKDKKASVAQRYAFYVFYPLHFFLLSLLAHFLKR